jgi:hypothetical protein
VQRSAFLALVAASSLHDAIEPRPSLTPRSCFDASPMSRSGRGDRPPGHVDGARTRRNHTSNPRPRQRDSTDRSRDRRSRGLKDRVATSVWAKGELELLRDPIVTPERASPATEAVERLLAWLCPLTTRAGGTMTAIDPSDADDAVSRRDRRARRPSKRVDLERGLATSDTVRAYLREIGRVSLLTGELEVLCAKRIEKGLAAPRSSPRALTEPSRRARAPRARGPRGPRGEGSPHRGEPASRRLDRQALPQPRDGIPRPHPGGQPRPDARGREVRLPPRLQVLDLCDLVDPPGDLRAVADQARTIRIPVHMVERSTR